MRATDPKPRFRAAPWAYGPHKPRQQRRGFGTKLKSLHRGAGRWHQIGPVGEHASTLHRQIDTKCGPVEVTFNCTVPEEGRFTAGSRRLACSGKIVYHHPQETWKLGPEGAIAAVDPKTGKQAFDPKTGRPLFITKAGHYKYGSWLDSEAIAVHEKEAAKFTTTSKHLTVQDVVRQGEPIPRAVYRLKDRARNLGDQEINQYRRECNRPYDPLLLAASANPAARAYGMIRRAGNAIWRTLSPTERDCVDDRNCLWGQKCIKGKCK
jgi:hypothetical protein